MINFAENLNKMITAGLGGETEAPRSEVAIGYRVVYLDASGPVAEFETNVVAPIKHLLVTMEPIQEGSGDPSPENIRPITGYDSVTVTHKGKNILDLSAGTKGTLQPEGTKTFFIGNSGLLPTPDGSFTLSAGQYTFASYGFRFKTFSIYDSTGAIITTSDRDNYTFAIHETGSYVLYFSISPEDFTSWDDVWVVLARGASAGEYEPYQADTITISLDQTVYDGTLDVTTGKLTVTKKTVDLGTLGWRYNSSTNVFYTVSLTDLKTGLSYPPLSASIYKTVERAGATQVIDNFSIGVGTSGGFSNTTIIVKDNRYTDPAEFAAAITGQELLYDLDMPEVIDVTPEQITTLIGNNNVWSDSGDVEVTYTYYEKTEGY